VTSHDGAGTELRDRAVLPVLIPVLAIVLVEILVFSFSRVLLAAGEMPAVGIALATALAILVGVPLGILAGSYRAFDAALAPIALFGRNIPIAALIPLTILWFGIEETQKTMFIFLATVPFVFSGTVEAVLGVHERYVETAQTLGANQRQVVSKVLIALALPSIYNNLRNLFGLAFGYIMLAELINAKYGLGYLLSTSQRRGLTEHIILILMIIGLLAFAIDRLLLWFQSQLFPYLQRSE